MTEVWDGQDWADAQAAALGARPRLSVIGGPKPEPEVERPGRIELAGDYDVESIDLSRYDLDAPGAGR